MILSKEQFLENLTFSPNTILGIDGPCGSGKTTLAEEISTLYDVDVIHMDDFFLPLELRTIERLQECGGNIHYERFHDEVIKGILSKKPFHYRKFDCATMSFTTTLFISNAKPIIIEGSYSFREDFFSIYTSTLYLEVTPCMQQERLIKRVGETRFKDFKEKWIPKETAYFEHYHIKEKASIVIK